LVARGAGAGGHGRGRALPQGRPEAALAALAIGGLDVSGARVLWDDRQTGQSYRVDELGLSTGIIEPGKPLDVQLGFQLDSAAPALRARVDLDGRVDFDAEGRHLEVAPMMVRVTDLAAEGVTGMARLDASIRADLRDQTYTVKGLRFEARAEGEGLPSAGAAAELSADVAADLSRQTLEVTGLELKAGRLALTGGLSGTHIQSAPQLEGDLQLAEVSPRKLMADLGIPNPDTADPGVLERLSAVFHLRSTPEQAVLDGLSVQLDDTRLQGSAKVLQAEKPAVRFDLQVDAIDLDRYLPARGKADAATGETSVAAGEPSSAATAPAPAGPAEAEAEPAHTKSDRGDSAQAAQAAPLIPVDTLRGLDVAGVFRVGSLIIQNLQAREIVLTLSSKDGRLRLDDEVGQFYDGTLRGDFRVDVTAAEPRIGVEQHLSGIQAGPLLRDLTGEERLTGSGRFNVRLDGSGQTLDAIKRSLGGTLDFDFRDGALKGFNLAKVIREGKARLAGKPLPPDDAPDQTDFSELSGSANITNGVLSNRDLLAKSPFLRVTGEGSIDLVAEAMDYTVTPVVVSTEKGQGGEGLDELKGVPVPVHLTGTFAKPKYDIDWKTVVVATQKGKIDEKIDSKLDKVLGDKVDDQTKDQLRGVLKGLFH